MKRRVVVQHLAGLAGLLSTASFAQTAYPSKPIRLVVPWPAGGLVDVAARQFATRLQAALGQPVLVDNKPGAGGNIGADLAAKAPADGHTLLFTTSALAINHAMASNAGVKTTFDMTRDIEPVALIANSPSVLVVGPGFNPASVADLVAQVRAKPGKFTYASAGIGSPAHVTSELFKVRHKLFVVHVPYSGAPGAMNDQLAGRVDYQFANLAVALPQLRAGKVRALAITSAKRVDSLPQVPTMAEAGVTDFEADQWLGLLAPRGLPAAVTERLALEVNKVLGSEEVRALFSQSGVTAASPATPAAFAAHVRQDLARWTLVIRTQGIKPE